MADEKLIADLLKVGIPSSSSNKTLEFNTNSGSANPKIRANKITGQIEFANDGVNFKGIGSGSGSGRNYVDKNPDAETNSTVGWSTYNDSFTIATTDVVPASDTIASTLPNDVPVSISTNTTLPGGLSGNTTYYTVSSTGTTVKLSATLGGTAIDITSTGTGTHTVRPLIPLDGTGGTATSTWAATSSNPLRGSFSFLWTKDAADRGSEGVGFAFTLDKADTAMALKVSFDYQIASGTYSGVSSASDISVFVYDVTNSQLIRVSPEKVISGSAQMRFSGIFQTSSNGTSYRVLIHNSSGSGSGYAVEIDNISVGPQAAERGVPVTDWQSYSLTIGATVTAPTQGTGGIKNAIYRRVGDSVQIQVQLSQTVAGSAGSGTYLFSLPPGLSVDFTKLTSTSNSAAASVGSMQAGNSGTLLSGTVYVQSSTNLALMSTSSTVGSALQPMSDSNASYSFTAVVPIAGWSSTAMMSNDYGEGRVVAANYKTATGTLNSSDNLATYTTKVTDTHASYSSGIYTVPVSGIYSIQARVSINGTIASGNVPSLSIYINGSSAYATANQFYGSTGNSYLDCNVDGVTLNIGDTVKVMSNASSIGTPTYGGGAALNFFSIAKQSGNSQVTASESVTAKAYTSAAPVLASGATLNFTSVEIDSHNAITTGAGTLGAGWRYTASVAGVYQLSVNLLSAAFTPSAGNTYSILLYKTGSANKTMSLYTAQAAVSQSVVLGGTQLIRLLPGDYINVVFNASSGGMTLDNSASPSNSINILRVGN